VGAVIEAIALGVALVLVVLTRGSFRQLAKLRFHGYWLLFGALGIQVALELVTFPRDRADDFGFALVMLSYVLILGFCSANLRITGMSVVTIGIAMNALVIGLNQGMPTRVSAPHGREVTAKHRPEHGNDVLKALDDRIVVRGPVDEAISFGDLIIAVGLIDVLYRGSRRPRSARRRRRRADRVASETSAPAPEEPDEADQADHADQLIFLSAASDELMTPRVGMPARVTAAEPSTPTPPEERAPDARPDSFRSRRERREASPARPPTTAPPPEPTFAPPPEPTATAPKPRKAARASKEPKVPVAAVPEPTPPEVDRQFWPERAPRASWHPSLLKLRRHEREDEEFVTREIDLTAYDLPEEKFGGLRRALRPDEAPPLEHPLERPEDPGVIDVTGT